MIVLIRCNNIVSDSRAKKYIDFYQRQGYNYKIIAWDRIGEGIKLPHTIYCPAKSHYNQGGIKAIIDRLKWMYFIICTLFSMKDNLKIHACDLDAAFPAVIYKMLSRRKNYVLFDVFDWISDTLYNQGTIVSLAFKIMEWISVKKANHIIICEQERESQIPYNISNKFSVLPNIPAFTCTDFLFPDKDCHFNNKLYTISYVGGFTEDRCLKQLIQGAAKGAYNLCIAGYGCMSILNEIERNKKCKNLKYFGKVTYEKGLRIMYNSDLIYAMYSKVNPNHLYAAPNKYYEAMFVGKALITTIGILLSNKVISNKIGYGIDESEDALINLIENLENKDILEKSENASKMWEKFKATTELYLQQTYTKVFINVH